MSVLFICLFTGASDKQFLFIVSHEHKKGLFKLFIMNGIITMKNQLNIEKECNINQSRRLDSTFEDLICDDPYTLL